MGENFFRYPAWVDIFFPRRAYQLCGSSNLLFSGYRRLPGRDTCPQMSSITPHPPTPGTVALKRTETDPQILISCTIRDIEQLFHTLYDQRYQRDQLSHRSLQAL